MKTDKFGVVYYSTDDVKELLYKNPGLDISRLIIANPEEYNKSATALHLPYTMLQRHKPMDISIEEFDSMNQNNWYMPNEYKTLDIAKWVLEQCQTDEEIQRVGQELIMFQERELFDLLRFMKYFVDTMRQHNVIWGVGRGSSVASYVLFLIGVHKINSIYFQLPIEEFLK